MRYAQRTVYILKYLYSVSTYTTQRRVSGNLYVIKMSLLKFS